MVLLTVVVPYWAVVKNRNIFVHVIQTPAPEKPSPSTCVSTIRVERRLINSTTVSFAYHESPARTESNNEGDSNVDTCCLGSNFVALEITNRTAEVYPYDSSYEPIANVTIVTDAVAYNN